MAISINQKQNIFRKEIYIINNIVKLKDINKLLTLLSYDDKQNQINLEKHNNQNKYITIIYRKGEFDRLIPIGMNKK